MEKNMLELLSPAGNYEKLETAIKFGADAVYMAGKRFGLRAFAGNFEQDEIIKAAEFVHSKGKKLYITMNILAHEDDFEGLKEYLDLLVRANVDAVIVSDVGLVSFIHEYAPTLNIHISTQANVLNSYAANFFINMGGVTRIILARELSINEIKKIRQNIPSHIELECFVHGAMCISYSGRCLLSNYLTGRDSNRGACVQACRWEYTITEKSREGQQYEIQEDKRGTYILNSKDMNMIRHLKELADAGVTSFKIEGRMKSPYYVANVTNAYRRAIDQLDCITEQELDILDTELYKTSHRQYTTGFYYGATDKECLQSSMPVQTHEFMAIVLENQKDGKVLVEMRNRFEVGDVLEVLSNTDTFNKQIKIEKMEDVDGKIVEVAKNVQQKLYIYTNLPLCQGDILRKQI